MGVRRWIERLRRYFLTGLVSLLPTIVVGYILWFFVGRIQRATNWTLDVFRVPTQWWAEVLFPVVFLLLTVSLIIIVGVMSRSLGGRGVVRLWERLIVRIPVLSRVYVGVQQIVGALSFQRRQPFKGVVLVEYPREGMYRLGLITAEGLREFVAGEEFVSVFVPSTPNPMGGFLFLASRAMLRPVDVPVEEAIKMVVSGGFVTPAVVREGLLSRPRDAIESGEVEAGKGSSAL
jgi:uncharacterized membrane protein